jgi:hypothetical protein
MLTFASGLAVVLSHNVWSKNPAAVVSPAAASDLAIS